VRILEWLNDDLTRALIVRGWWKWKRVATVVWLKEVNHYRSWPDDWAFAGGHRCPTALEKWLDRQRDKEIKARRLKTEETVWVPLGQIPEARLISG
jgi:hypothetical protein